MTMSRSFAHVLVGSQQQSGWPRTQPHPWTRGGGRENALVRRGTGTDHHGWLSSYCTLPACNQPFTCLWLLYRAERMSLRGKVAKLPARGCDAAALWRRFHAVLVGTARHSGWMLRAWLRCLSRPARRACRPGSKSIPPSPPSFPFVSVMVSAQPLRPHHG